MQPESQKVTITESHQPPPDPPPPNGTSPIDSSVEIGTHFFEQRYLYAFASRAEVAQYIRTQAMPDESKEVESVLSDWANLQPRVQELMQEEAHLADTDAGDGRAGGVSPAASALRGRYPFQTDFFQPSCFIWNDRDRQAGRSAADSKFGLRRPIAEAVSEQADAGRTTRNLRCPDAADGSRPAFGNWAKRTCFQFAELRHPFSRIVSERNYP